MKTTPKMLQRLERTPPYHVKPEELNALIYDCRRYLKLKFKEDKDIESILSWLTTNATEAHVLAKAGGWK